MTLIGVCPSCDYEGFLKNSPSYVLDEEDECPDCGHIFTAGGGGE